MMKRSDFARASEEMKIEMKIEERGRESSSSSDDTVSEEEVLTGEGNTKCKQAYIDYRKSFQPKLADYITDPDKHFSFTKNGFKCSGDFYEIR